MCYIIRKDGIGIKCFTSSILGNKLLFEKGPIMLYFLTLSRFVISLVNLGTEFKHLIKVVRIVHFNLKHSDNSLWYSK